MTRVLSIVVDYQTSAEASHLCAQLSKSELKDIHHEVVHVDNGNSQPVALTQHEIESRVHLLRLARNDGYAGGLNGAIQVLDSKGEHFDYYWFLNSDLEVDATTLQTLLTTITREPLAAAIGPQVYNGRTGHIWGTRGAVRPFLGVTAMDPWTQRGPLPIWSYIPGCSLLVKSQRYHELGGLPSRYRLYFEETEFCVQLQKRGYELWIEPDARVYHMVKSMENKIPARHYAYYVTRNNLYFWRHNFGIPWYVQLPRMLYISSREILIPLRRARSWNEFCDRLKYFAAGIVDAFFFLKRRYTPFEKKLFQVTAAKTAEKKS